jgi:hypothetical protein
LYEIVFRIFFEETLNEPGKQEQLIPRRGSIHMVAPYSAISDGGVVDQFWSMVADSQKQYPAEPL